MKKLTGELLELAESIILALVAVMVVFTLFFRIYQVDGPSMENTLHKGDRLLVSQLFYTPRDGDIVCFVAHNYSDKVLVKRVIATPGEVIDITPDYKVTVNGKVLDEPYLSEGIITKPGNFVFPYTVKEGEVFCMGDNRVNSTDSRALGAVETKYLLGRLIVRVLPNPGVVR